MNLYAILAVICHVGSRKLLLFKLLWDKSCRGVSLVTQELLLLMFLTRYLDLLYLFVNVVDELVKVWGTGRGLHGAWCEGIIWLPKDAGRSSARELCVLAWVPSWPMRPNGRVHAPVFLVIHRVGGGDE